MQLFGGGLAARHVHAEQLADLVVGQARLREQQERRVPNEAAGDQDLDLRPAPCFVQLIELHGDVAALVGHGEDPVRLAIEDGPQALALRVHAHRMAEKLFRIHHLVSRCLLRILVHWRPSCTRAQGRVSIPSPAASTH
jgi:hypothetical protein